MVGGIRETVALVKQDNKQRFPLWVRAAHGHNVKLQLDDKDIAVNGLTLVCSEAEPLAPYKGRPCIPVEEIPPRLYHRTVEDAAFAILDDRLIPGFGNSGNKGTLLF